MLNMKCNSAGTKIAEDFEEFRSVPYTDQRGRWTQGYGHTLGIGRFSPPCTPAQGVAWLTSDMATAERAVNAYVTVPLTSNQFSALCDFVFNEGAGSFYGSSARHLLNYGAYDQVPAHLALWNMIHDAASGEFIEDEGLTRRRAAEISLWNTPDAVAVGVDPLLA